MSVTLTALIIAIGAMFAAIAAGFSGISSFATRREELKSPNSRRGAYLANRRFFFCATSGGSSNPLRLL